MRIVVLGLGEAGSLIAADLVAAGVEVVAFDPARVVTPDGVDRCSTPTATVKQPVDAVLALTAQADASTAMIQVLTELPGGTLYADLSSSAPGIKKRLAAVASPSGVRFADVALVGPVPGNGLRTPAIVSGPAAEDFAALVGPLGMPVQVVGPEPGDAAVRNLLRSIVSQGVAALVIEAMDAAETAGVAVGVWDDVVDALAKLDESSMRCLLEATDVHAERLFDEMESAEALLTELGTEAAATTGVVEVLSRVIDEGLPPIPPESSEGA